MTSNVTKQEVDRWIGTLKDYELYDSLSNSDIDRNTAITKIINSDLSVISKFVLAVNLGEAKAKYNYSKYTSAQNKAFTILLVYAVVLTLYVLTM